MFKLKLEPAAAAKLETLQVLRAVAALLVVFSHILRLEHEAWMSNSEMYLPALPFGDFGVYSFFVISGFIMYFTAGQEFGVPGAPLRFLRRRLSRIAPTYWLFTGLALLCPFVFGWRPASPAGMALSLAFLPDLTHPPGFEPVLAAGWTLPFEMLFYAVFACCLVLPRRIGLRALILAFPLFIEAAMVLGRSSLVARPWWPFATYWARLETLLFVCGVAMAMAQAQFGRVADRRGVGIWLSLGMLVLTPAGMFALAIAPQAPAEMALAAVAVMFCVMSSGPGCSGLKPLVRLGDASYALYLSHSFVIGALSAAWLSAVGPHAPFLFATVALGVSCATARVVHLGLERPLTRASQRILDRLSFTSAPALPTPLRRH
jgi:peptidoglycan/LPS O-acetylase OafA/YrhL